MFIVKDREIFVLILYISILTIVKTEWFIGSLEKVPLVSPFEVCKNVIILYKKDVLLRFSFILY